MAELFTLNNLFTLIMLILLQVVLGFDNLLYISIESKRVASDKQSMVRRFGIGLAVVLRIVLLVVLLKMIEYFKAPFLTIEFPGFVEGQLTVHSFIVMLGGVFIIYTSVKEIWHMISIDVTEEHGEVQERSAAAALFWIVAMNLVFSFDSILSAIALTKFVSVMAIAIIFNGILMICLADFVAEFLKKNRMVEVLGLFILFIVGIMLLSEGGHLSHLAFFGYHVEAMAKSTFYFAIAVLILTDLAQSRYQKKLLAQQAARAHAKAT